MEDEDDVGTLPAVISRARGKRRTTVFSSGSGGFTGPRRSSIHVSRKSKDSSESTSIEKENNISKAALLWDKLRTHVVLLLEIDTSNCQKRGFFRSILAQTETAPTFVRIVNDLWKETHLYSFPNGNSKGDSTTDFVMSGLATVKASRPSWARPASKNGADSPGYSLNFINSPKVKHCAPYSQMFARLGLMDSVLIPFPIAR
jgi:hypothetical protein